MSGAGKQLRMSRFLDRRSGRGLVVPLDHGLTLGPIEGLESVERIGQWAAQPGINGLVAHKGMAERLAARGLLNGLGLMVHLNGMHAMAGDADRKELVTSVEAALRLGADAVSVQLNFDGRNDAHNLKLLGSVADEAYGFGLPVLTMLYDKQPAVGRDARLGRLRHLMRLCLELGTDALKLAPPDDLADVPVLLDGLSEDVAIFFAGGTKSSDEALLALADVSVRHGGTGLCVGRNVFQRPAPSPLIARLGDVLHKTRLAPAPVLVKEGNSLGIH